jgi:aminobenzoyl-glutamate utilization protein B
MATPNIPDAKRFVFDFLDRNARTVGLIGDSVFHFAELGMQEYESAKLMTDALEAEEFKVTRGLSGFPTGFLATYGSGSPVIALHTEYDANPENSQAAGVAEPQAIVEGAPGHCEGHNVNAAVLVSGAIALKRAMAKHGIKGTLKVFGAPAEELVLCRPYYVRDGHFDDVDIALHPHVGAEFLAGYGLQQSALVSAVFNFVGESAHAGTAPWKGRDALDGVVLMDMGMAQYREHMMPTMRAQRTITNGGRQPNVIPKTAAIWWYFRDPSAEGALKLFEQAKKIAQGAALMTNTEWSVDVLSAVWPTRGNRTVAETVQRNIELIGMPDWSAEEEALAKAVQTKAGAKDEGLPRSVTVMKGPSQQKASANDGGDVSWKVPMVKFYFPSNIPGCSAHHWSAGVSLATSIAHKGAVAGAKAMAAAALDFFTDPAKVAEAHATFKEEIGDIVYRPLLPPDQVPPVELNRAQMEPWRAKLAEYHIKEKPVFA